MAPERDQGEDRLNERARRRGGSVLNMGLNLPQSVVDIPEDVFTAAKLPGGIVELWRCSIEHVALTADTLRLNCIVPDWEDDNPGRLILTFGDAREISPIRSVFHPEFETLRSIRHWGNGLFDLSTCVETPSLTDELLRLEASDVRAQIQVLSRFRPPYLRVFFDEGIGLWDSVTGLGGIELDDVELPVLVREQVEAWMRRAEKGSDTARERNQIVSSIRREWPNTVVSEGPLQYR